MFIEISGLLLSAILAGLSAGLLGLGGGIIIVPTLTWVFHNHFHIPATHQMHLAVGTSLATIVATTLSSTIAHHRRGVILWPITWQLIPGLLVGALFGAYIASFLSSELLKNGFGIFMLLVALQLGFGMQPPPHYHLPKSLHLIGFSIGGVSTLMGIGGGSLTVPFLVWCNVSIRHAIAIATTCGLCIALTGTLGFMITGWQVEGLPAYSSGFIYWPAVITIVPVSILLVPVGTKLSHILPAKITKKIFSVFLMLIGMHFLID